MRDTGARATAPGVTPGQLRHSDFLAGLEQAVADAAEPALSIAGRTARDCPFIRAWFEFYRGRDAETLLRALERHAPETRWAATAEECFSFVGDRARRASEIWATTGRIAWNAREVMQSDDPRAVQAGLGPGRALESSMRGRAESVLREDFSRVRVHTGGAAEQATRRFGMRALAVGQDIAFAPGEYQPGTPEGDAILAHELAHVAQQKAAAESAADLSRNAELERDANGSATGAVIRMWAAARGAVTQGALKVKPALRTGLRLQGCGGGAKPLQFGSLNFTFDANGLLNTSDTGAHFKVETKEITSSGRVVAAGGTNAEASDWQAGYIQTIKLVEPLKGEYLDSTGAHNKEYRVSLPGPTRDGVTGRSDPLWYDEQDSVRQFEKTNTDRYPRFLDNPRWEFPWTTADGAGKLATTAGYAQFGTWLVVRQISTRGVPTYLNWARWDVGYSAKSDYSSTGWSKLIDKDRGDGKGRVGVEPVLDGPIANDVVKQEWI
jgi:hypothetical protein